MYIIVCHGFNLYGGCILQCGMVVITMLVVYYSTQCFSSLCLMYIAMCYGCHCSVGSILQSADVLCCSVLQRVVIVITILVGYCSDCHD